MTNKRRSAFAAEAENQLALLTSQEERATFSDFYSYRYFASEGFLPGYNFPRLPLAAFIPGRRGRYDDPEYLNRPRFWRSLSLGPSHSCTTRVLATESTE